MQKQTSDKENATSAISSNAKETHKEPSNLVERNGIEGSPFQLVKTEGKYFLAMGMNRITEPTETEEETMDKFITEHWNITVTVMAIVCRLTLDQIEIIKEIPQG